MIGHLRSDFDVSLGQRLRGLILCELDYILRRDVDSKIVAIEATSFFINFRRTGKMEMETGFPGGQKVETQLKGTIITVGSDMENEPALEINSSTSARKSPRQAFSI